MPQALVAAPFADHLCRVNTVFATGGSSLVPAVRKRLADRFGAHKLCGGEELTSVAWGLAARAREVFG